MDYISTRGSAPTLDFRAATLAGLASDGGLYVPAAWPQMSAQDIRALAGLDYAETAVRVMMPFVAGVLDEAGFVAPPADGEAEGPAAEAQVEEFRAFLDSVTPEDFEG